MTNDALALAQFFLGVHRQAEVFSGLGLGMGTQLALLKVISGGAFHQLCGKTPAEAELHELSAERPGRCL